MFSLNSRLTNDTLKRFTLFTVLFFCSHAIAEDPEALLKEPKLLIDGGTHLDWVWDMVVDRDQRFVVTVSDEKTARVWSLPDLKLIRTLRVPIGLNPSEGKLYATALSPDGQTLAVSGVTGYTWDQSVSIYLFDITSGEMVKRLVDMAGIVARLRFDPENKHIYAGMLGEHGVNKVSIATGKIVASHGNHGGRIMSLDVANHGRVVTSSADGYVRLFDSNLRLIKKRQYNSNYSSHGRQLLEAVLEAKFSPDGKQIAVTTDRINTPPDYPKIRLLSADKLRNLKTIDVKPPRGQVGCPAISRIRWSSDSQYMIGYGHDADEGCMSSLYMKIWANGKIETWGKDRTRFTGQPNIPNLVYATLNDGGVIYYSRSSNIVRLDSDGEIATLQRNASRFLSERFMGFFSNDNGSKVMMKVVNPEVDSSTALSQSDNAYKPGTAGGNAFKRIGFDVLNRQLMVDSQIENEFYKPLLKSGKLDLTVYNGDPRHLVPRRSGREMKLDRDTTWILSKGRVVIDPVGKRFVASIGRGQVLKIKKKVGVADYYNTVPAAINYLTTSRDGKYSITMHTDGVIRWFTLDEGKPVLSLFLHSDDERWVMWTPEGFFDHSPGGEELIGFHLNRGTDQEPAFVSVARLYDLYYRPDLVRKKFLSDEMSIASAIKEIGPIAEVLAKGLPPKVAILSTNTDAGNASTYPIDILLSQQEGGIGKIVYRINGIVVGIDNSSKQAEQEFELKRQLPMLPGLNEIEVSAYNAENEVESLPVTLTVSSSAVTAPSSKLHVLSVGVNDYQSDQIPQLSFAVSDAVAIAEKMKTSGASLFAEVNAVQLLDQDATLANIQSTLKTMSNQIGVDDVFVLFIAGHGLTINGKYNFLPQDVDGVEDEDILRDGLSQDKIQTLLADFPSARSVVILDTCEAGSYADANDRQLVNRAVQARLSRATGRAVLSASTSVQEAVDGYKGHGVFSHALLEALSGNGDKQGDRNGNVSVLEIARYSSDTVPKITRSLWNHEQTPVYTIKGRDFDIGKSL